MTAGLKNKQLLLILTDYQILNDQFLVPLHHLMALTSVRSLYPTDQYEAICDALKKEAKEIGTLGEPADCWQLFERKVRDNFHVVLCMSPVDETFRIRCRDFPFIINSTTIDWFHEWPEEALLSVAKSKLEDFEALADAQKDAVTVVLAKMHRAVEGISTQYRRATRRENFTTPKSYISFIDLYRQLMDAKTNALSGAIERLENGLAKLGLAAEQVDGLQAKLAIEEGELAEASKIVNEMLSRVVAESQQMEMEREAADVEERHVNGIAEEVALQLAECQR